MQRFVFVSFLLLICLGMAMLMSPHTTQETAIAEVSLPTDTLWKSLEKKLTSIMDPYTLAGASTGIPQAHAANSYDAARAYIAVDFATGKILAQKNIDVEVPIASLTKLMSSVVALDLAKPTDEITISTSSPTVSPTTIGVVPGQNMTVHELLEGMLMTSANDAAQAVADGINAKYQKNIFVAAMNEKAKFLGLQDTHFSNPEGFDGNNYSSAHDLAILTHYALTHYPDIAQIVGQEYVYLPATTMHKQYDLYNWNGLLGVYPGISGVKIGNTSAAGYTMIVTSTRDGKEILSVVLGAPGILERDEWMAQLLNDTFSQQYGLSPVTITPSALQAKYATWHYWG